MKPAYAPFGMLRSSRCWPDECPLYAHSTRTIQRSLYSLGKTVRLIARSCRASAAVTVAEARSPGICSVCPETLREPYVYEASILRSCAWRKLKQKSVGCVEESRLTLISSAFVTWLCLPLALRTSVLPQIPCSSTKQMLLRLAYLLMMKTVG